MWFWIYRFFSFTITTATNSAREDVAELCHHNVIFANTRWAKMEGKSKMNRNFKIFLLLKHFWRHFCFSLKRFSALVCSNVRTASFWIRVVNVRFARIRAIIVRIRRTFARAASLATLPTGAAGAISSASWENTLSRKRTNVASAIRAARAVLGRTPTSAAPAPVSSPSSKLESATRAARTASTQIFQVKFKFFIQFLFSFIKIFQKNFAI